MERKKSIIYVLVAAFLFGSSAPISKILLGKIEPVLMASLLYLGSGIGLFIYRKIYFRMHNNFENEAPLRKQDYPWLIGAITFGGIIAPIILMISLKSTPASTASLLLNFEGVATTLIAIMFFKESAGKNILIAILLITLSSIFLSWDFTNQWGISLGALGIIVACFCWGMDNNLTGKISAKDPFSIVMTKGLAAGSFSFILALVLKNPIPSIKSVLLAMLLGCFSYGFSIAFFVLAIRGLGTSRTSALFGTAPFIGTILSFILFKEVPNYMFIIALPIMIVGTILLVKENHVHIHIHEEIEHEHKHCHNDNHHYHSHDGENYDKEKYHSHKHIHKMLEHSHEHTPDIHHKHEHVQK